MNSTTFKPRIGRTALCSPRSTRRKTLIASVVLLATAAVNPASAIDFRIWGYASCSGGGLYGEGSATADSGGTYIFSFGVGTTQESAEQCFLHNSCDVVITRVALVDDSTCSGGAGVEVAVLCDGDCTNPHMETVTLTAGQIDDMLAGNYDLYVTTSTPASGALWIPILLLKPPFWWLVVPSASGWSVIVATLLLLTIGTLAIRGRKRVSKTA